MNRTALIALTVTLAFAPPAARTGRAAGAQDGGWRTQSPPDKRFGVELPVPLREVVSFSGEHQATLEPDQKSWWCPCYAGYETDPGESRFGVVVVNARQKYIRSQPREGRYGLYQYLGAMVIGNEDEPEPTSVKEIGVNGLRGKEFIYTRGGVATRGRMFETGGRIYVVVFVGKNEKDLASPDAERFLNSFRLLRGK